MNATWLRWIGQLCALFVVGCASGPRGFADSGGGVPLDGDAVTDGGSNGRPDAIPVADTGDPALTPDSACATKTFDTQRAPMNLLIVLDRSGSMAENGKWEAAVRGINRLLDLLDDQTRVGLSFFPAPSNGDTVDGYRVPHVPIAALATNRAIIRSRLSSTNPFGNTPMACVMPASVDYYHTMFTLDGSKNIVLITDGAPTQECSGITCDLFDVDCHARASMQAQVRIQAAVAHGAMLTPPVRTFVVGTPEASDGFLSNLAINGGTRRAAGCEASRSCHYSLGHATFEMDLNHALDDIRGRAAPCEFRLMIDPARVDRNLVNVNYIPYEGATPRLIPRDSSHTNGWDYSPDGRNILLYGPACDEVRMNPSGGRVQILFGCPTVTPG